MDYSDFDAMELYMNLQVEFIRQPPWDRETITKLHTAIAARPQKELSDLLCHLAYTSRYWYPAE